MIRTLYKLILIMFGRDDDNNERGLTLDNWFTADRYAQTEGGLPTDREGEI